MNCHLEIKLVNSHGLIEIFLWLFMSMLPVTAMASVPSGWIYVLTSSSGCKLRLPYDPNGGSVKYEVVNWSGACDANGFATGGGVEQVRFVMDGKVTDTETTTKMVDGVPSGPTKEEIFTGNGGSIVYEKQIEDGRSVGTAHTNINTNGRLMYMADVDTKTGKIIKSADVGSSTPNTDDQSEPSVGVQVLSGVLQGVARGAGNLVAQRTAVQASRGATTAQRAQVGVAASALAKQQAAMQAQQQQSSSYSQPAIQASHSQDATGCISVSDNSIHNGCNTTVSVVWCVQGDYSNCGRGYDNESDILAGGEITALPLKHPGTTIKVNYAACTGSNNATAHGWSVKCD